MTDTESTDNPISAKVEAMLDPNQPTAPLDEFRRAYEADDNWWWRIVCGHHQNLFEMACEEIERLEVEVIRVRMAVESAWKMLNSR